MALIKCPHCGQSVLSIASQCPKCSKALVKSTYDPSGKGELGECRDCGRSILNRTSACPHCGARRPGVHYARGFAMAGVLGVIVLGLTAMALFQPAREAPATFAIAPPPPTRMTSTVALRTIDGPLRVKPKAAAGIPSTPVKDSAPLRAAPKPIENIDSSIAHAREALALASPSVTKPAAPRSEPRPVILASVADPQLKWTATWANVRGSPYSDSQVVQVLRPGQQVAVAAQRRGWWVVLENGRQVGYVARQLLVDQPTEQ